MNMNILDFAKDGNADEAFAQIREAEEFNLVIADELVHIADDYEKGKTEDALFCEEIKNHFNPKTYVDDLGVEYIIEIVTSKNVIATVDGNKVEFDTASVKDDIANGNWKKAKN